MGPRGGQFKLPDLMPPPPVHLVPAPPSPPPDALARHGCRGGRPPTPPVPLQLQPHGPTSRRAGAQSCGPITLCTRPPATPERSKGIYGKKQPPTAAWEVIRLSHPCPMFLSTSQSFASASSSASVSRPAVVTPRWGP